jgi:hypothetical protein
MPGTRKFGPGHMHLFQVDINLSFYNSLASFFSLALIFPLLFLSLFFVFFHQVIELVLLQSYHGKASYRSYSSYWVLTRAWSVWTGDGRDGYQY